jgi:hypothetical protein
VTTNVELFPTHTKSAAMRAAHSNETADWYSPPDHVALARQALGPFTIDPASSAIANRTIQATVHGGRQPDGSFVDGLALPRWDGTMWINAPSSKRVPALHPKTGVPLLHKDGTPKMQHVEGTGPKPWWCRTVHEVEKGHVRRAHWVSYSVEQLAQSQKWTPAKGILAFADATVMLRDRVCFWKLGADGELTEGEQPAHATAYSCIVRSIAGGEDGRALEAWCDLFAPLGDIVVVRR